MVMFVATVWDKFVNVATPFTAVAATVPCNVPLPASRAAVTTVLLSPLCKLPNASSMRTAGCCPNTTPAVAVGEGCVRMVSLVGPAALTEMTLDVAASRLPLAN